jgi:hypothetical protein
MSNGLHSERLLQTCPQCNGQCKRRLQVLTGGPQDLARSSRYRRRRLKASVSFNREKQMSLISSGQRRHRFTECVSDVNFIVTGFVFMPVTKVPYGPREIAISHDRWLVVVTVVVWCPLRILYVLRRAWNIRVSVHQDSGDAGAQ